MHPYNQQLTIGLPPDQWEAIKECLERCIGKHKYRDDEFASIKGAVGKIGQTLAAFRTQPKWKNYTPNYEKGHPNLDISANVWGWICVANNCLREFHPDASNGCACISAACAQVIFSKETRGEDTDE